ncbi:hypothetical protein ACFZC5_32870 [Nocardia gamkensis]|uniref:hypothetical protein n=1 Tax=Nocardia gamkensis TaxID=352869 RepID=UPI0036E92B89
MAAREDKKVKLEKSTPEGIEAIGAWWDDPDVRAGFGVTPLMESMPGYDRSKVLPKVEQNWFIAYDDVRQPVAAVNIQKCKSCGHNHEAKGETALVMSWVRNPLRKGEGFGTAAVQKALTLDLVRKADVLCCHIISENADSLTLAMQLDFEFVEAERASLYYRRVRRS